MNILVSGALGRMGQEVIACIEKDPELNLICGFNQTPGGIGNIPVYDNIQNIKETPDVIVDFSHVNLTLEIIKYAVERHVPIVIATTGFTEEQNKIIEEYSKQVPIFKSANMSFDINLMCRILSEIAPLFANTDIEITETHHRNKVDSPSGTALLLADSINKALDSKLKYVFNRHDLSRKRGNDEIGFTSIRGGNIVGEHTVQFFGPNDTFEIKHTSYSRSVFAEGSIKAAKFIIDKPNGLYSMNDLV